MKKREGDPWVSPPVYGRSLRGLGINLLVRDTARAVAFARDVLGLTIVYADPDLAVLPPRRARVDGARRPHLRRPPAAAAHAHRRPARRRRRAARPRRRPRRRRWPPRSSTATRCSTRPTDKPHGLREAYIIDADGYVWVVACTSEPRRERKSGSAQSSGSRDRRGTTDSLACRSYGHGSTARRLPGRRGVVHRGGREPPLPVCARRRRSRPSTSSPRRSSPATSIAACCRSRTRSQASCPTRSRSSRRARSRSSRRSRCTSRTSCSGRPGRRSRRCASCTRTRWRWRSAATPSTAATSSLPRPRPPRPRAPSPGSNDIAVAAIASPLAARSHGLAILADEISDHPENLTRFVALARFTRLDHDAHTDWHTALRLITKHEPGALHSAIEPLRYHDVQMTSLHSRPIMGEPWRYQFYIDVVGIARPHACCARSRTCPSAAPSCTCSAPTPSAAGCGERDRRAGAAAGSTAAAWACSRSAT